ncbi:hypothetical protein EmuJ_000918400 [Echinococcus multilocularis]|uniref:Uncharacterized protein n=1 Tax=Echinococcus multilocularis TaxID=6211 RepID=A0A068YAJ9_ECHMU|nr:hypothetical protein EmuJ_000918400 [Echinococcus multilocularis]
MTDMAAVKFVAHFVVDCSGVSLLMSVRNGGYQVLKMNVYRCSGWQKRVRRTSAYTSEVIELAKLTNFVTGLSGGFELPQDECTIGKKFYVVCSPEPKICSSWGQCRRQASASGLGTDVQFVSPFPNPRPNPLVLISTETSKSIHTMHLWCTSHSFILHVRWGWLQKVRRVFWSLPWDEMQAFSSLATSHLQSSQLAGISYFDDVFFEAFESANGKFVAVLFVY